jgi:hypothetical protein
MFEEEREAENRTKKMWLENKMSDSDKGSGSEDFDSGISSSSSSNSSDDEKVPK